MQTASHEFIDGLLPWFVNSTLAPDEHGQVLRHLERCETCQANVSMLSVVQTTLRHPTATPLVPPARAERLLETIDGNAKRREHRRPSTRALLAASLAAVLLAGALLLPNRQDSTTAPSSYETVTSTPPPASMDYVFSLRFEPQTPLDVRERVLRTLEARDTRHDETNGVYRITVNLQAASLEELRRYMRNLESMAEIESVAVVALQLPVEEQQ